nr:uncharacterized protein LOC113811463 isoform X8 [Penaeus vannamei]
MQVCVTEALIHSHEMQLSLVESVVEGDEMKLSVAESIVLSDDIQLSITETLADSDEMQLSVAEAVVDSDEMQQLSIAETVIDSDEMQLSVTETVVDSDDMQQSVSEAIVDNEDTQLYVSEAIVKNDDCKVFLERYDMRLDTEADVAGSDEIQILPEVEIAGEVGAMQVSSGSSAFTGMRQEDIDADLLKYECDRKKQRDSAWEKEKRSIRRRAFYKPPRVDDEENKTRTIMSTGETHYIYDPSIAEEPHHSESTSDLHSAIVEALSFRYFTDTIGKTEIEVRADESQVFESNVLDQGDPENQLTGLTLQEPDFARGTEIIHDYADMPTLPPDVIKVSETVCQVEEVEGMDRMCEVEEIVSPAVDLASGIETIHIGDYSEEFDKVVSIVTVTSSSESDSDQRVFLIDEVHNISEVESPEEDVTADIISDCLTEDMEAYATESDESMADMGIVEVSETVCLVDEIQEMFDLEKIGEIRPLEEEWRSGMEIIHQAEKSECFSAVSVKSVSEGPLSHTMTVDEYPSIKCNVELSTDKEMSSSTGAKAKVKDISKERITKTSGEVESTNVTHETESVKETKQCQEIMKPDCGLHGCESIKGELFEPSDRVNIQSSVEREKEKVPPDDSGGIEDNFTISIPEVGETDSWLNVIKAYQDQSTRAKQEYLEYDEYRKDESRTDDDVRDTVSETVVKTLHESSVCKVDCESFGNETGKRDLEEVHEDITRVEQAVESLGLRTTDSLLEQVSGSLSNERASEVEQPSDIVDEESLKLGVLDRVSEELKAMISNLEQNLAAGTSRNVRITPILARLEQLEQEVASLTPVSEPQESSIPNFSYAMQTHDLVSTPQASATEEKGRRFHAENLSSGNITSLAVNMPVGTQMETTTLGVPGGQSPIGEMNGQDIQDALTDVEDLNMDGESPIPKQKQLLLLPEKETGAVTDTEDMDLSGDENDIIPEKANLPTIQDLGVLPEPTKEVINLTEGYAREASPLLLSDSDSEREDVQNRHKKNIKKGEKMSELEVPGDDEPEGVTDVEDMVASGDEIEEQVQVEDSLPDHYLDQGEGVSNQEKMKAASPKPKVFKHHEDSSDDEKRSKKQVRRRSKASLTVQPKEDGTTDVEDLVFSDLGEKEEKVPLVKKEAKEKIKRKKQIRRKSFPRVQAGKNLSAPVGDTGGATDTEILTGDDDEDEYEEDDTNLGVAMYDTGAITDSEDVAASDTEDIADIVAAPLKKKESSIIPEPHAEKIRISETEEAPAKDSEGETDEEGFQLDDNEDEKPLVPRKRVVSEPIEKVVKEALEVEEPCEAALTDTEDFDLEDKEEEEVISDIASRIPTEGEIYTIKELESEYGQVTKKEIVKDADAELKELIREAEAGGLTLQEALNCEALTDVEDLDDDEPGKPKPKIAPSKKVQKDETATDEESVDESDIEEEIRKPPKRTRHRGKRLPLVPQVSEVRFVETDQGPLSIIITPDNLDNNPDQVVKDKVTGVVFLESEEKEEATTDVEELQSSDDEGQKRRASILNAPQLTTEPATDTEDFDVDAVEVDRPLSPLPPDLNYNVLSSPKREIIHIKEDKYGVPQVTIRKLQKDELLVSDVEDMAMTDTEDIEVSDAEALRLVGATTDSTAEFELPDTGKIEVSSTMKQKNQALHVDADEEGGSTDVEELQMTKKSKRKGKSRARLEPKGQGEDSHTDVELLSDQDDRSLTVRTESPRAHTDTEDFVTSETEDLGVPERDDAPTPDVIKNAAIKKVIILKEGPHGVTQTEEASVVQTHGLRVEDEPEGVTDIEDMEASGAEDDDIPEHPGVELPEQEHSSVDISEKTSIPKDKNEAKHIKDNLLLPEDNYNNLTDVESLDGGEGTHEATQIAEHQTTTVSQEQAHGKSKLTEADLAVLESMVIAQEAEVEEMAFAHDQAEAQAKAQEEQLRKKGQQQKPKVKGQKKQDQAKGQLQQGKVEEQALLDKAQAQIHQEKIKGQLKDKKSAQPEVKNETQSKAGQVQQSQEGQKLPSNVESLIQPTQTQQVQLGGLAQSTQGQVESLIQPTQFQSQAQQVQVESLIQPTQVKGQAQQVQVESLIQPTQVKGQAQQVQVGSLIQPTQVKGQAQQVQVGSLIQPTQVKGQAEIQFENLSQPPLMKSQAQSQAETKDQMQQGQVEYILQQTSGLVQQPQTGEAIQGQVGLTQQLRVNGHQQQIQTQVQREGQSPQDKVQALIQSQGQVQTLKQQETPSKQIQPETTTKIQQSTTRVVSPGKGHAPTLASAATPAGQTKQQQFGDLTKRVADVASTMASTLESITAVAEGLEGSHLSSDEGEEQLMLMRDSPRWEDEEIQAEETDEPRAIKAEIKLLVKTTEVGKESIEIRSIREFVESDEKNLSGFGGIVPSPVPEAGRVTPQGDRVYTLQRGSPSARTPSPRFVRQQQSSPVSSYIQPTHDEFDLMAQVRDVVQPDSGAGARQAPGVGVDEMSSVMESYTSDGSDPITTTHTTRIIRRTEVEDGEVKEDVYEEY